MFVNVAISEPNGDDATARQRAASCVFSYHDKISDEKTDITRCVRRCVFSHLQHSRSSRDDVLYKQQDNAIQHRLTHALTVVRCLATFV